MSTQRQPSKSTTSVDSPTLTDDHREYLRVRGIDATACNDWYGYPRYRSVDRFDDAFDDGGFGPRSRAAGMLITVQQLDGSFSYQLRPDSDPTGKRRKFIQQPGPSFVDVGPDVAGAEAVVFVEGLVKLDAAREAYRDSDAKIRFVGILGADSGFRKDAQRNQLHKALEAVVSADSVRRCVVMLDADWQSNKDVHRAMVAYGRCLKKLGVEASAAVIPAVAGDHTGIDDYLAEVPEDGRFDALREVLRCAVEMPEDQRGGRRDDGGRRPINEGRYDAGQDLAIVCAESGDFYLIDGLVHLFADGIWRPLESDREIAQAAVNQPYLDQAGLKPCSSLRKELIFSLAAYLKLKDCQATPPVSVTGEVNIKHWTLWPFKSGMYDLDEDQQRTFRRDDFATYRLPYDPDESGDCPHFDDILQRAFASDEDRINAQIEMSHLVFEPNSRSHVTWFHGVPGSAKSTMVTLIGELLGDGMASLDEAAIWQGAQWAKLPLVRCRIALVLETARGLPAQTMKNITGKDLLTATPKFGSQVQFRTLAHLLLTSNQDLASFLDPAMKRRLRPLHFARAIPENEQDQQFDSKLRGELGAIWCRLRSIHREHVKGKKRLPLGRAAQAKTDAVTLDGIDVWAKEQLTKTESTGTLIGELLDDYCSFDKIEQDELSSAQLTKLRNKLTRRLGALGIEPILGRRGYYFCEIRSEPTDVEKNDDVQVKEVNK